MRSSRRTNAVGNPPSRWNCCRRNWDRVGITLKADAARRVVEHVGEDGGGIGAVVEILASTFGAGARLDLAEIEPYLSDAGAVRPYELTNRIEEGDVAGSLTTLQRLMHVTSPTQPKPMHPLQVLGILHSRYRKLARLEADAVLTADDAYRVWGGKGSTFPAKKGLEAARALGAVGFTRAFAVLHRADVSTKGASGLSAETVVEIAVARLAQLHQGSRRGGRRRSGAGRR